MLFVATAVMVLGGEVLETSNSVSAAPVGQGTREYPLHDVHCLAAGLGRPPAELTPRDDRGTSADFKEM